MVNSNQDNLIKKHSNKPLDTEKIILKWDKEGYEAILHQYRDYYTSKPETIRFDDFTFLIERIARRWGLLNSDEEITIVVKKKDHENR